MGLPETPDFEHMPLDDGLPLRKCWFSVSDDERCAGSVPA